MSSTDKRDIAVPLNRHGDAVLSIVHSRGFLTRLKLDPDRSEAVPCLLSYDLICHCA
jgi:hypothetical protein